MAYNEPLLNGFAMFLKNRELRIKVAKTKKNEENDISAIMDDVVNEDSAQLIEELGRKLIRNCAITAVVVFSVIKVADTLGEIAVKKTKSADQK
jgi:diaminopimelate decarboxylase